MNTFTEYKISKYSQATTGSVDVQWSHHTMPQMRVLLTVGKADNIRLQVIGLSSDSFDRSKDIRTLLNDATIFEDLQMTAHEPTSLRKAAYKGAAVAIRYQHPDQPVSSRRRFQVIFQNDVTAHSFMNSTAAIFQFRLETRPTTARAATMLPPGRPPQSQVEPQSQVMGSSRRFPVLPSFTSATHITPIKLTQPALLNNLPAHPRTIPSSDIGCASSPLASNISTAAHSTLERTSTLPGPSTKNDLSSSFRIPLPDTQRTHRNTHVMHVDELPSGPPDPESPFRISHTDHHLASLSPSSRLGSKLATNLDLPVEGNLPPPTQCTPHPASGSSTSYSSTTMISSHHSGTATSSRPSTAAVQIISSLGSIQELNGLPAEQLEKIVVEVIREPGFITLLEKLDKMWEVKAFLGR